MTIQEAGLNNQGSRKFSLFYRFGFVEYGQCIFNETWNEEPNYTLVRFLRGFGKLVLKKSQRKPSQWMATVVQISLLLSDQCNRRYRLLIFGICQLPKLQKEISLCVSVRFYQFGHVSSLATVWKTIEDNFAILYLTMPMVVNWFVYLYNMIT